MVATHSRVSLSTLSSYRNVAAAQSLCATPCRRYLVKWVGYNESANSWEPAINLDDTLAGMGRRGGRGNIGSRAAAQSEIASCLTWN